MSKDSKIGWCHHTHNFWWGCERVKGSPACTVCYAEAFAKRVGQHVWGPPATTVRRTFPEKHNRDPFIWNNNAKQLGVRQRVFVNSMSDFFEWNDALEVERNKAMETFAACTYLDFLLLTKRPDKALAYLDEWYRARGTSIPLGNVWVGVTAEHQALFDERVRILVNVPAAVKFVSYEPAIGPLNAEPYLFSPMSPSMEHVSVPNPRIDWIIVGGVSGAMHKKWALDMAWVASIVEQTQAAGAACFVKQDSGRYPDRQGRIPDALWNVKQWPRSRMGEGFGVDDMNLPEPAKGQLVIL